MCAVWDFRANVDLYTVDELLAFMRENTKKYSFQIEKGDTGYVHYQGRFSLIKKRQKSSLMKLFDDGKVPNYLEPTAKENHKQEFFYCLKKDTRIEGPWTDKDKEKVYVPTQYSKLVDKLYPYQKKLIQMLIDLRKLILIYDPEGNKGKSSLSAIFELYHNGIDLPSLEDYKELVATACNIVESLGDYHIPRTFLIDMPRAMKKDKLRGMYSALEQIKKGKLFDVRYKYKSIWIETPQVIVFTNTLPDYSYLSNDRWDIYTINDDMELEKYSPDFYTPTPMSSDVL